MVVVSDSTGARSKGNCSGWRWTRRDGGELGAGTVGTGRRGHAAPVTGGHGSRGERLGGVPRAGDDWIRQGGAGLTGSRPDPGAGGRRRARSLLDRSGGGLADLELQASKGRDHG